MSRENSFSELWQGFHWDISMDLPLTGVFTMREKLPNDLVFN